jgi:hypothetical protein
MRVVHSRITTFNGKREKADHVQDQWNTKQMEFKSSTDESPFFFLATNSLRNANRLYDMFSNSGISIHLEIERFARQGELRRHPHRREDRKWHFNDNKTADNDKRDENTYTRQALSTQAGGFSFVTLRDVQDGVVGVMLEARTCLPSQRPGFEAAKPTTIV